MVVKVYIVLRGRYCNEGGIRTTTVHTIVTALEQLVVLLRARSAMTASGII